MSILHPTRSNPTDQNPAPAPAAPLATPQTRPVPRTRMSAAWVGICTGAVVFIALIVFMLQNTRSVEISFLGLHGTAPLSMTLLIAMVGGILLALVLGTARIAQLRRLARGRRS